VKEPIVSWFSVIGVELGREDHSSISTTAIGRGLEPLDTITDLKTD
jgi:hypothetical protein